MTDPDNHRSQARLRRQPVLPHGIVEQPNFGLELAAQIPEVHIPEHINAPRQFPMPAIFPLGRGNAIPAPGLFGALVGGETAVQIDDLFAAGVQARPIIGWGDVAAQLPPVAPQPARRGRRRPRDVLSGPQANVDLNNVHRGHIAHREQVDNHRVQQLQARLQEEQRQRQLAHAQLLDEQRQRELEFDQHRQRELELELEAERQRWLAQAQLLNEQRQRDLEAEQQRQRDLTELQRQAEIQRQLALELENLNDVDEFQPPEVNAQVRNFIHDQWRAEHERELDPDLNDIDFDEFDVDDWQRLDDAIARAFPLNEQQEQEAANIYGENRRFENQARRDMQNHQDDVPDLPQRDPRDLPRARRPYVDLQPNEIHNLGPMNVICAHCNALHWDCEKLSSSTGRNPKFGSCCLQGQIQLPPLREPPRVLRDMLCGISPHSKTFRHLKQRYILNPDIL
ncbi:hypothetical protein F5887DRAFT_1185189 [Amanita rubescens]|nr:hypothetical protein F5887DRAFT_1185189 [Amanita rubescens]